MIPLTREIFYGYSLSRKRPGSANKRPVAARLACYGARPIKPMRNRSASLSPNHAMLSVVTNVIHDTLIPQLKTVEDCDYGVVDALATCGTVALATQGFAGGLIGFSRVLVEETYQCKGWPKPSEEEVLQVLAACFKDRSLTAMAIVAAKASQLRGE